MPNEKNNSGAFFENDKSGNDKKPDYRGNLLANNEKMYVSVWKRVANKSGNEFLSLSFSVPNTDFSKKDPDLENNKGALFENLKKEGNQPDFQGKVKINGINYYIDAWKRSKDGKNYFSFSIRVIEMKENGGGNDYENHDQSPKETVDDLNQSIPFDDNNEDSSGGFDIFTMGQ